MKAVHVLRRAGPAIMRSAGLAIPLAILLPPVLLVKTRAVVPVLCVVTWLAAVGVFFGLWAGVGFLLASLMSCVAGALMTLWHLARR